VSYSPTLNSEGSTIQPSDPEISYDEDEYMPEGYEDFLQEMSTRSWWNEDVASESQALVTLYALTTTKNELPKTFKQAIQSKEKLKWEEAIKCEMDSLIEMGVFIEIVDSLPKNEKAIKSRWVFDKKFNCQGFLERYKARLVAKGYLEKVQERENNYSPTSSATAMRILIAKAAENDWEVFQDDQKTAFLNADIKGKWIQLPDGKYIFITKALYGLRESPRKWFFNV
jgi:hypothetical protein